MAAAEVAGVSGALGVGGNIVFTGGTLQYSATNTADYSARIKSSTSAIAIDTNGQAVTYASVLDNTNNTGLTLNDTAVTAGSLTLSAVNTYTGATTVTAGLLRLDLYGRTKFLGEVSYPHTVTLRTSIIGHELKTHLGLIEWFLMQQGSINGYKKAIFSGFTTDELSRIILKYVIPNNELSGLYHVSSEPISKFDLLQLANKSYQKGIDIQPDTDFFCDRSLNSTRFRQATGYNPPSWSTMIDEMASGREFYDQLKRKI